MGDGDPGRDNDGDGARAATEAKALGWESDVKRWTAEARWYILRHDIGTLRLALGVDAPDGEMPTPEAVEKALDRMTSLACRFAIDPVEVEGLMQRTHSAAENLVLTTRAVMEALEFCRKQLDDLAATERARAERRGLRSSADQVI
jgi:hypothetical protein